eukprot:Amastigsp_a178348_16.p2 type:complete len:153 gc:universal Amastigsp_a178348_16:471-13(-)
MRTAATRLSTSSWISRSRSSRRAATQPRSPLRSTSGLCAKSRCSWNALAKCCPSRRSSTRFSRSSPPLSPPAESGRTASGPWTSADALPQLLTDAPIPMASPQRCPRTLSSARLCSPKPAATLTRKRTRLRRNALESSLRPGRCAGRAKARQ